MSSKTEAQREKARKKNQRNRANRKKTEEMLRSSSATLNPNDDDDSTLTSLPKSAKSIPASAPPLDPLSEEEDLLDKALPKPPTKPLSTEKTGSKSKKGGQQLSTETIASWDLEDDQASSPTAAGNLLAREDSAEDEEMIEAPASRKASIELGEPEVSNFPF